MEEVEIEEIKFTRRPAEECDHEFKRLLFIAWVPDYGHTIHDARVRKCFKCDLVIAEDA